MRLLSLTVLLVVVCAAPVAFAERVPPVLPHEMPVAGTCAPIPSTGLTWVTVGELGWYRVDRDPREIDGDGLTAVLAAHAKAASEAGATHDVWIVASKDKTWAQISNVVLTCQAVGLYRVGLQVASESGDGLMGFPLFLPRRVGGDEAAPAGRVARGLPVDVRSAGDRPSHLSTLYAAVSAAVERFSPVVVEVKLGAKVNLQYAVSVLDLCYRAGCAGIRLKHSIMGRRTTGEPLITVQDATLGPVAYDIEIPPIRPRKTYWPESGAGQPGALSWNLEPVPNPRAAAGGEEEDPTLPNYAATGGEVPTPVIQAAQRSLLDWASNMGRAFTGYVQWTGPTPPFPGLLLASRKRQPIEAARMLGTLRETFPPASSTEAGWSRSSPPTSPCRRCRRTRSRPASPATCASGSKPCSRQAASGAPRRCRSRPRRRCYANCPPSRTRAYAARSRGAAPDSRISSVGCARRRTTGSS
ncbi:MAG: hypothetical protein ACYTG6_05190 [Planctomycetota bacterium]|jgi:biopolymer transport protein ExbD